MNKKKEEKKDKKQIILIVITIVLVSLAIIVATYAYYTARELYGGSFEVDITSRAGVDTFTIEPSGDISILADKYNFNKKEGDDVSGSAYIDLSLFTSKDEVTYCYTVDFQVPNEVIMEYSNYPNPELVVDISKIEDGKETKVIRNLDITVRTDTLPVPVSEGSDDYIHKISAKKHETKDIRWKAAVTIMYYKDFEQDINRGKKYESSIKVNVVQC